MHCTFSKNGSLSKGRLRKGDHQKGDHKKATRIKATVYKGDHQKGDPVKMGKKGDHQKGYHRKGDLSWSPFRFRNPNAKLWRILGLNIIRLSNKIFKCWSPPSL